MLLGPGKEEGQHNYHRELLLETPLDTVLFLCLSFFLCYHPIPTTPSFFFFLSSFSMEDQLFFSDDSFHPFLWVGCYVLILYFRQETPLNKPSTLIFHLVFSLWTELWSCKYCRTPVRPLHLPTSPQEPEMDRDWNNKVEVSRIYSMLMIQLKKKVRPVLIASYFIQDYVLYVCQEGRDKKKMGVPKKGVPKRLGREREWERKGSVLEAFTLTCVLKENKISTHLFLTNRTIRGVQYVRSGWFEWERGEKNNKRAQPNKSHTDRHGGRHNKWM